MNKFFSSPLLSFTVEIKWQVFTEGRCVKTTIDLGDSPTSAIDVAEDVLARKALLPSELPRILPRSALACVGHVYAQCHSDLSKRRHFSSPILNLQISRDQVWLVASALKNGLGGGIAPAVPSAGMCCRRKVT